MKKIFSLLLAVSFMFGLFAADKKEKKEKPEPKAKVHEPAVIYSLPKTVLVLELEVSKVTEKPGPYFNYSDRLLALKDVVKEQKTYWEISNVRVYDKGVPDKNKTFELTDKNANIQLTREGLICGINYPCPVDSEPVKIKDKSTKDKEDNASFDNMVLTEDQLVANNVSKMAENAAKQIFRIRDSRLNLITGDNEKLPADGESLKLMLKKMDQAEASLMELFTGKKIKSTITRTVEITPDKGMKNEVIMRFSTLNGLVDKDDLSGTPFYMTVTNEKNQLSSASTKGESGYFYNIPAKARVEISFGDKPFFDEIIPVAQFGSVQALPDKLAKKGKVRYEPKTGTILSIEK